MLKSIQQYNKMDSIIYCELQAINAFNANDKFASLQSLGQYIKWNNDWYSVSN